MSDVNDFNRKIVEEFRAKDGHVGGMFEGTPLLILHSTGARSGVERLNPVTYKQVGESWAIFASKAGATSHPDWYHNLVAHPSAKIEIGTETVPVVARVAEGDERAQIWSAQKSAVSQFDEYEQSAGDREIPVVVLDRA